MARFIITGGTPLSGHHKPPGNKNAALPMLAACLLTDEPVRLTNLPLIDDVRTMLAILDDLGVSVDLRGHSVTLRAKGVRNRRLDPALCHKVRSSILFAGPLAARYGQAAFSPPGGDVIGRRRLDSHFLGLRQLGIVVSRRQQYFTVRCRRLAAADILLDEASVTATENVVMAACLARGTTTVFNAACEPHVQDLCRLLNKMGAHIRGVGTNHLTIHGKPKLGGARHRIAPDYIEAAGFVAAAALTGGALSVADARLQPFQVIGRAFDRLGIRWSIDGGVLSLPARQKLRIRNDVGSAIPKIEDGTWPSIPSDLMSVCILLATQAKGTMLFFEKMFESRMYFVDHLIAMGARIVQCDPHRVIVSGPARLQGCHLSSPDIRAGMALLLAALCAEGESIIENAQSIDRGYEQVDRKLRRLGARIRREA
jgi:UDP-N-acetylglucosamine 1-carboxyvinyltransferase